MCCLFQCKQLMGGVWSLLLQIKENHHDADENQARLGKVLLVVEQFVVAEEQARRLVPSTQSLFGSADAHVRWK